MQEYPTPVLVVAVALVAADGRVCLQQRPPGKAHAGLWEFPGGKVERGESPDAALVREIAEELGIALDTAALAPCGFAANERLVILLYACERWTGTPEALEGGAVGWYAPSEIGRLAMPPLDYPLATQIAETLRARAAGAGTK